MTWMKWVPGRQDGEFEQTPSNHLLGRGCPECGKRSAKRRKQKKDKVTEK